MVWNQSEEKYTCGDAIHASRDYIRQTAITYQSFGLDKNKALPKKCFIFWRYRPDLNWGMRVLQTLALPLGHGTIQYYIMKLGTLCVPNFIWSGWRGSNSLPPPWQGGALPDELHPHHGASGRNRTNDTRIFSPLLYLLSYRGMLSKVNFAQNTQMRI